MDLDLSGGRTDKRLGATGVCGVMYRSRGWVQFVAILMIGYGVISAVLSVYLMGCSLIRGAIYLGYAAVSIVLGAMLNSFNRALCDAYKFNDDYALAFAFKRLRNFFVTAGVLAMVQLAVLIIALVAIMLRM